MSEVGSHISEFVTADQVYTISVLLNQVASGTDNPLVLIKNPAGNGRILYLYKVALSCTAANVSTTFRLFADPTITANGTVFTPVTNNVGSSIASTMLAYTLSVVSSGGTPLDTYIYGQNSNSLNFLPDFSIHVNPGHSLLVTGNPTSSNRQAAMTLTWTEL